MIEKRPNKTMLFKILDNLRLKPKHVRDQYAFGIAVFFTLAIGGVWSLSLPSRFAGESQVAALASTTNAAPFSNFFTQLKEQFQGVKKAMTELPQATTTAPLSAASSTAAALDLELTQENKDALASTSLGSAPFEYNSSGTKAAPTTAKERQIMIATTSAATTQ